MGFQESASPSGHKPVPLIVAILVIAVAAGVFGYLLSREAQPIPEPPQISGLEVTLHTSQFLDTMLQPDGVLLAGYSCNVFRPREAGDVCLPLTLKEEQPHTGQAIYAYYLLAQATGEQAWRARADLAMDSVLRKCETDDRMCEWNYFPIARYYFDTKDEQYLTRGMLPPAERFLTMAHADVVNGNVGHKLASLSQATGDRRYRERLVRAADQELQTWPSLIAENKKNSAIQVAWSLFLPAYSVTQDPRYLAATEQFFDSYNIVENIGSFANVEFVAKGTDALLTLSDASSKGAVYKAQARQALQEVLLRTWDTPENRKFNGDYGFLYEMSANEERATKSTLFNGWLMKSYLRLGDEMFALRRQ